MDEKVFTSIERRLMQDGKPISAKLLAVQHKIQISKARSYLEEYLKRQEKEGSETLPFALYILFGEIDRDGKMNGDTQRSDESMELDGVNDSLSGKQEGMYLSDRDHLEETKSRFSSNPSISIYALNPPLPLSSTKVQKIASISQLQTIQHELKNTVEYVNTWNEGNFGAIKPSKDIIRSDQFKPSFTGIVPTESNQPAPKIIESKITKPIVKAEPSKPVKKEEDNKKKKETVTKKKAVIEDDEEEDDDEPIGYSDKISTDVPIAKGGAVQKKADAVPTKPLTAQEEKRRRQKQELIDMMDEDRDGNADPDVPIAESTATTMMGEGGKKKRVQKERKVIRKERYTNEKGYKATRDVEETELYSTDESESEGKAESSSTKASKGSKAKTATQKNEQPSPPKLVKEESQKNIPAPVESEKKVQSTNAHPKQPPSVPVAKKNTNKPAGGQSKLSSFFTKKA